MSTPNIASRTLQPDDQTLGTSKQTSFNANEQDEHNASTLTSLRLLNKAGLIEQNTMQLECTADTLVTLHSESKVAPVVATLRHKGDPIFLLSGGSNVILPHQLHASVIRPVFKGLTILNEDDNGVEIEVMGGENWHKLVTTTVNKGWYGLENLALIPGLVGASPVQNIGAYGVQLEDCLTYVKAFHLPSQRWHHFTNAECEFDYRDSKFKREAGQWFITRVGFKLHKDPTQINANYGDVAKLAQTLTDHNDSANITPVEVMQAIIEIRQSKLPDPKQLPNCGSFFKNPIIDTEQFLRLKEKHPNIVGYKVDDQRTKVAAGWLIDTSGLKGKGISPIFTHAKQALVIVNHSPLHSTSPATQKDILATQQLIQNTVFDTFGITLEREPVWLDSSANYVLS